MKFTKNSGKKDLTMNTSVLKEVSTQESNSDKNNRGEEEAVKVTSTHPKSTHERLLDLVYFEGLTLDDIMQEAAIIILEKYNPKQRPQKIKERRRKPGRPKKLSSNHW